MLDYELKPVGVGEEIEKDERLKRYLEEQKRRSVSALVTDNVKLEEHHRIYGNICQRAEIRLMGQGT